ncbi:hypothetical protein CVT25_004061 [Psilocybe cyanescens]|uniref:Fungal-type protein kinase domain-containing protein n=1 Tax=Psilocybe cyanescens TaxID=93625 RepID=A0A409XPR4_PSICY|nr:hypothetical protein CVT25_004061 [Psilocybe cyanescens]
MQLSEGTAQFMARDLLQYRTVHHGVRHDVESFIWVFSYCVMRNLYDRASKSQDEAIRSQKDSFLQIYRNAFGQTTYREISERRNAECFTLEFPRDKDVAKIVAAFMSKPLISLVIKLGNIIHDGIGRRARNPINREAVLEAVKKTILEIHVLWTGILQDELQAEYITTSNTTATLDGIKEGLKKKIQYDDSQVFSRLHLDAIDNSFVSECAASLLKTRAQDIAELKDLIASAENRTTDDPYDEECRARLDERDMYDPLVSLVPSNTTSLVKYCPLFKIRLFRHIQYHFEHSYKTNVHQKRAFRMSHGLLKADEPHMAGKSRTCPDLTVAPADTKVLTSRDWAHRDAFGEVTVTRSRGPKAPSGKPILEIVAQRADYARLFLAGRPFMLFCVGILIFGTEFCVGMFDRDGVTFSPVHDMFKAPEAFVRVVHSITHNLSIQALGLDPTVEICTRDQTTYRSADSYLPIRHRFSCRRQHAQMVHQSSYVDLVVAARTWDHYTSLEQRNTLYTKPRYELSSVVCLANNWRKYKSILSRLPRKQLSFRVLEFLHAVSLLILSLNLRTPPVLHRLVLCTVGRPMWEYQSEKEFLLDFHDILLAHKRLVEQGALHRDISAGNVLLSTDEDDTVSGFITDLDLAYISPQTPGSESGFPV